MCTPFMVSPLVCRQFQLSFEQRLEFEGGYPNLQGVGLHGLVLTNQVIESLPSEAE